MRRAYGASHIKRHHASRDKMEERAKSLVDAFNAMFGREFVDHLRESGWGAR